MVNFQDQNILGKSVRLAVTSGAGSYNDFADFKAAMINRFVEREDIESIIEFGCGDGNQLKLADYPSDIGFDVSQEAISAAKRSSPMMKPRCLS